MAVTVTLYNHTRPRVLAGLFPATDTYKVNLYTTLPANATATTKAAAESGATQVATANGYAQDTKTITGLVVNTVSTTNGSLTFDNVNWDASGGSIAAAFALIYDDTAANDPPYARIDFGGTVTAAAGTQFRIAPDAAGFITLA